jgi:hypothetical protein
MNPVYRKDKLLLVLLIFFVSYSVEAQNILIVERPGTIKNYKYYTGDEIKLKTISTDATISGMIIDISDSSLIINHQYEIMISDITIIYRNKWGFRFLQYISLIGGLFYLGINTLNGVINSDDPIVPEETLIISGSMIGFGIVLTPLTTRRYKIDKEKWRIVILDFTD